jgi:dihydropteroate synthase
MQKKRHEEAANCANLPAMKDSIRRLMSGAPAGRPSAGVIGVVNVTPDSFSDGGRYFGDEAAIAHGRSLIAEGADLLDVGGESTAPGSKPIDAASELSRIEGVVRVLAGEVPLSIDTYRAVTAARCLELGATMVNDVSALRADPDLAAVVKEHRALLALSHVKDSPLPHATDDPRVYEDVIAEIGDFLLARVDVALAAGIDERDLILDPGWGRFISLDPDDSWRMLRGFECLVKRLYPMPLMVCTSRKGFLAVPMEDRDPVSQLTALVGVMKGGRFIRTHRPRMAQQFLEVAVKMGLLEP